MYIYVGYVRNTSSYVGVVLYMRDVYAYGGMGGICIRGVV